MAGRRVSSAVTVDTWFHFAIGACVFILIAAAFDFANTQGRASLGARTLDSFVFGLKLMALAGVGASVLWLGMRALKGKGVADFRDSVLWSACLIGGLVILVRMIA